MAMKFREITDKAEQLMDKGREAQSEVESCQTRVAASVIKLHAAQRTLEEASETDEEGNPRGDVEAAEVQVRMAQGQLAAGRRALSSAQGKADRVRREKNHHVQDIEQHNRMEQENLRKLQTLSESSFGANAAPFTSGIAKRMNQADDARVKLLKSMGIAATADHVAIPELRDNDYYAGKGGGFAFQSITGMSAGTPRAGNRVSSGQAGSTSSANPALGMVAGNLGVSLSGQSQDENSMGIQAPVQNRPMSIEEKIASLQQLRAEAIANRAARNEPSEESEEYMPRRDSTEQYIIGLKCIDDILDGYKEDLRKLGFADSPEMKSVLLFERARMQEDLSRTIDGDFSKPYIEPSLDQLTARLHEISAPPEFALSAQERQNIREDILSGKIGEVELRKIGRPVKEYYHRIIGESDKKRLAIETELEQLALAHKNTHEKAERNLIREKRERLIDRKKTYDDFSKENTRAAMVKKALNAVRSIGPSGDDPGQAYSDVYSNQSAKTIKAINGIREFLPAEWLEKSNNEALVTRHVKRGFYGRKNGVPVIALSGNKNGIERCAFHEFGHRAEDLYPEIRKLEHEFYNRRTQGEELKPLGGKYKNDEMIREDTFVSPYMGKDYGNTENSYYEILSMGLQSVYSGDPNIYGDPEYESFVFGILSVI